MSQRNPSPPPEDDAGNVTNDDSIGSTTFSKHFVLSTLVKLLDNENADDEAETEKPAELEKELEDLLCQLWDMSTDAQVGTFLIEIQDFIKIVAQVLKNTNKPRVTEILAGILANLSCHQDCLDEMKNSENLCELTLSLLSCRDPPTLIETTRLLNTILTSDCWSEMWEDEFCALECWDDIEFLLGSSTNEQLLLHSAQITERLLEISEHVRKNVLENAPESFTPLIEAFKQCCSSSAHEGCMYLLLSFHSFTTEQNSATALATISKCLMSIFADYCNHMTDIEVVDWNQTHYVGLTTLLDILGCLQSGDESSIDDTLRNSLRSLRDLLENETVANEEYETMKHDLSEKFKTLLG